MGWLDDSGHFVSFRGDEWNVTKRVMVIALSKKKSTLYMTTDPGNVVVVAAANDDASLWHNKLGWVRKGGKNCCQMVSCHNLRILNFDMCKSFIMGKQKKPSFLTGNRTLKSTKLELVHTNLWGPSPVASLDGSRYYITFIDNCNRKVWVYFLKNKSNVFATFKMWKSMVETRTGLKLKCWRSNNGGEYIDGKDYSWNTTVEWCCWAHEQNHK